MKNFIKRMERTLLREQYKRTVGRLMDFAFETTSDAERELRLDMAAFLLNSGQWKIMKPIKVGTYSFDHGSTDKENNNEYPQVKN
jgi:hypothetical protein